jgi:hypothetical protein
MAPENAVAIPISQKRIDANRRNAQKSTGPRTPEGKSRSRFNGLKHGLTATVPVLPGEDPAAFQARLDAMIESCAPKNQVEIELLERVAATTWSLERATRAETAQLSHMIRNHGIEKERSEQEQAVAIGQRLLWAARGPWQLYPHHEHTGSHWETRTSWSPDPADPHNPALLILRLEGTVAGCRWLLDRWAELRARLEPGELWTASDQFKAIRLLGKQPLDAVDDPEVTQIVLASAKLSGQRDDTEAFADIQCELHDGSDEREIYLEELEKRPLSKLEPRDADHARQVLAALVFRHTSRLELLLARNQEIAQADSADAPDRLAFDPSPEGEKLRRYVLSAARLVNQTVKTFLSVVRCPLSVATEVPCATDVACRECALFEDHARPAVGPLRFPRTEAEPACANRSMSGSRPLGEQMPPNELGPEQTQFGALNAAAFDDFDQVDVAEFRCGEPSPVRTKPGPLPTLLQPFTSPDPEPVRTAETASVRTEPSPLTTHPHPTHSFNPEPSATAPVRAELSAPTTHRQPTHSFSSEPSPTAPVRTEPNPLQTWANPPGSSRPERSAAAPIRTEPNPPEDAPSNRARWKREPDGSLGESRFDDGLAFFRQRSQVSLRKLVELEERLSRKRARSPAAHTSRKNKPRPESRTGKTRQPKNGRRTSRAKPI